MVHVIIRGILSIALALLVILVILQVDNVRRALKGKKIERQQEQKEMEELRKRIAMGDGNITILEVWEFADKVVAFAAARYLEDCKQIGYRRARKKHKKLTNCAYWLAINLIKEKTKSGNK